MKTAVVILNWNGLALLQQFLPRVLSTCNGRARVVVADNASTDTSLQWIRSNHPETEIVELPFNAGFANGYNMALEQINSEYYILLNSDVEVTDGWLKPLVDYLDASPETAVCQPRIRWYKHREKFEYAGAAGGYIDRFGYPFCRGRIFGILETDEGQYDSPAPVFWATGACLAIRSKVFREAGGFDPLFFAHMEEIDLCWRIRNMGHEIECVPASTVFHVGGATLPKNNPGKTYLNFRNNLSMLYKNLPGRTLIPVLLLRLFMDGIAGLRFLTEGHWRDCLAVIKAHFHFYTRVISGKLSRPELKHKKEHKTIYGGWVVWDHYVRGIRKFSQLDFRPGKSTSL